jgi:2-C-methyl-D-erythritol 4-phosphate cytidylyltransferase
MSSKSVIISAGGLGKRMGSEIPKQFLCIKGKPVIMHTMEKFVAYDAHIEFVVVLPETHIADWEALCQKHLFTIPHKVALGGEERFHSIQNGLQEVTGTLVAVHDAVRPLVDVSVIAACFELAEKEAAAIPVYAVTESLRKTENGNSYAVNREDYKLVQTPQCFQRSILVKAYEQRYSKFFTDDASVVESSGVKIHLVNGNRENIKITTPHDLQLAELFLK